MVVAKTDPMHFALAAQFEARTTEKEYFAITAGVPDRDRDIIEQPIGMHPHQREKMAIRAGHTTSREATTFYEVRRAVRRLCRRARCCPRRAGRIRFACTWPTSAARCCATSSMAAGRRSPAASCGGGWDQRRPATRRPTIRTKVLLSRQALHARRIKLAHPATGEPIEFIAPLPADLQAVLDALRSGT